MYSPDGSPTESDIPSLAESAPSSSGKETSPPSMNIYNDKKYNGDNASSSNENSKTYTIRTTHSKKVANSKRNSSLLISKPKDVNNMYMKKVVTSKNDMKHRTAPSHVLSHLRAQHRSGTAKGIGTKSINISMDFVIDEKGERHIFEEKSNLFLYIDLHGHASKKGVFMYGNHLSSPIEAVECMLLPRLMSMNCHHFHFDACNFSERNMYYKYDII